MNTQEQKQEIRQGRGNLTETISTLLSIYISQVVEMRTQTFLFCALTGFLALSGNAQPSSSPSSSSEHLHLPNTILKSPLSNFPSLLTANLEDLTTGLEKGLFTSHDLVKTYIARIHEVNPTLHAVTELNPDALSIASTLDTQRQKHQKNKNKTKKPLPPLHGIPILLKNNIGTHDHMNNTAGSFSLLGARIPRDSTIAQKLRHAGAILLGKTNLSQWANYRSSHTSNGWSAHGGQTYGVYYPQQDPSGSSSGSGVSSALGLAFAALGTETSGSILAPAEVNNLVGIKPTTGLTSRDLVVPISERQDTVGPMARTVRDAAKVLGVIVGRDGRDNYTWAIPFGDEGPDYRGACVEGALEGARLGVARNVMEVWGRFVDGPVREAFEDAVRVIEAAGATVVEANFTGFEAWLNETDNDRVLNADFLSNLAKYFGELTYNPYNITDLAGERAWTRSHPIEEWPERDTKTWDAALEQGWNNTDPRFWPAYLKGNIYYGGEGGILGALRRTNTTAVLLPTKLSPSIPALVGSPVVTVPMGFYPWDWNVTMNGFGNLVASGPNIPFGLSFMGDKWSEETLIGYAYAYEQRTQHRNDVLPYIRPNTELKDVVGKL